MGGKRKFTIEEVVQVFASNGCEYLDNFYVRHSYKHTYRCVCGRVDTIQFKHFKRGVRCGWCSKNKKLNIDVIKERYKSFGFVLLDMVYINANHAYKIRCKCGQDRNCSLDKLQKGSSLVCNNCLKKTNWDIDIVKNYFEANNCVFIDNVWIGANHPHRYQCSCGNVGTIRMSHFKRGHRCSSCAKNGFKKDKPAYLYLIARPNQFKIGIYNIESKRITEHKRNGWDLMEQRYYEIGEEAYDEEQRILDMMENQNIPLGDAAFRESFDGYTESWNAADLFVKSIEDLLNKISN
jgi:hypothetical protein